MVTFSKLRKLSSYKSRFHSFQNLMRRRVRNILMVSSLYDAFILEEDGQLNELILNEYIDLNLNYAPAITRVTSGLKALKMIEEERRFSLLIISPRMGDMNVLEFTKRIKQVNPAIPVIMLAYNNREVTKLVEDWDTSSIDKIFLWQGDFRILLAIIKYVEDQMNVEHDTLQLGVQSILLIEDNIRSYSSFLPLIYTEIMNHSQSLISEGINLSHKLLRMRARPKILLASSFDKAWEIFEQYKEHLLGVISDVKYPLKGKRDPAAGVKFARKVREHFADMPVLLQSDEHLDYDIIKELEVGFLLKYTPTHLSELRSFILNNFGFGDFVFRMPDGQEVGRANDLKSFEEQLHHVPEKCLKYHGDHNHFSRWLRVRTEFLLAEKFKPLKVSDYASLEEMRQKTVHELHEFRSERRRGFIEDFNEQEYDSTSSFTRIGGGSIGGKARGLAFFNNLLDSYNISEGFKKDHNIQISVPPALVVGTDVFDRFIRDNNLWDFALNSDNDKEICIHFLNANFPDDIRDNLAFCLKVTDYPLAVRSSSLLEDSQYQPFAGIYQTYMLPNNSPDLEVRLNDLLNAIKLVYASTFSQLTKGYIRSTSFRLEEEKMAVIIQKVVGSVHDTRFYPDFAGVARSHNYYPKPPMTSSDGIVSVALGLGKAVMDGAGVFRFCPRHPRQQIQFLTVDDYLRYSQREFYALELDSGGCQARPELEDIKVGAHDLSTAEQDGALFSVASTYSHQNDAIYDGTSRQGVRLITFAPILKHEVFPLSEIVNLLLDMGSWGMTSPVEIEFAVKLNPLPGQPKEFGFLQMRPLVLNYEMGSLEIGEVDNDKLICKSDNVLGNGKIDDIRDIVLVDIEKFDRSNSKETAREVGEFNTLLSMENRPYILLGVGRWGSADPWLGIPVSWDKISGVRVIIEAGFKDIEVEASQGSHFFQNITSCNIGYFTVNVNNKGKILDWDWLLKQKPAKSKQFTRLISFDQPLIVKMNGQKNQGVIFKPGLSPNED